MDSEEDQEALLFMLAGQLMLHSLFVTMTSPRRNWFSLIPQTEDEPTESEKLKRLMAMIHARKEQEKEPGVMDPEEINDPCAQGARQMKIDFEAKPKPKDVFADLRSGEVFRATYSEPDKTLMRVWTLEGNSQTINAVDSEAARSVRRCAGFAARPQRVSRKTHDG